jgi:AAA domain
VQDRVHFKVGYQFDTLIEEYLTEATLLIPIITPDYFESEWCLGEFEYFWTKQRTTSTGPLIYPIYYIECDRIRNHTKYPSESVEYRIGRSLYADWRPLRHREWRSPVRRRLADVAQEIGMMYIGLDSTVVTLSTLPADMSPGSLDGLAQLVGMSATGQLGPPSDLPMLAQEQRLIGRSGELARVVESLAPGNARRIVCVEGSSGMGKTLLVAEAVRRRQANGQFPDGIAVVLCSGMRNPRTILREALTRFDSQRRPPVQRDVEGLLAEGRRLLHGRDAAIIFDDLEVNRDMARMLELLHSIGVAILITSLNARALAHVASATRVKLVPMPSEDGLGFFT